MFSCLIPFSGFYETLHDNLIDDAIMQQIEDTNGETFDILSDKIWSGVNMPEVREEYVREYVNGVSDRLSIKLEYEEYTSPKEYNFMTDRIFAKISRNDLAKMLKKVRGERLNKKIKDMFTSRSGFISFYNNDIKEWGRIENWDYNQIGAVMEAYMETVYPEGLYSMESDIIDHYIGNEFVNEIVYNNLTEEGKRISNIAAYLIKRQERVCQCF